MHDGYGIRTTVFLKGCPLRCAWCHNPETQEDTSELLYYPSKCISCGECIGECKSLAQTADKDKKIDRALCQKCGRCADVCPTGALELCGGALSVDEIIATVEKDVAFYGDEGGITLSGGEPLFSKNACIELLKACKERGLNTAVETCGFADREILISAIPYTDLFLWDIKDTDCDRHRKHTGVSNKPIIENLKAADACGAKTRLRCILVNGVNTDRDHYVGIANIALSLVNCEGVEFLPYHAYGGTKSVFLGNADNGRKEWIPTKEQIEEAKAALREYGANVF